MALERPLVVGNQGLAQVGHAPAGAVVVVRLQTLIFEGHAAQIVDRPRRYAAQLRVRAAELERFYGVVPSRRVVTIVNSQELGQIDSNSAARVREATNVTKGGAARRREIFSRPLR